MKIAKCTEDKKYLTSTGKGDNLLSKICCLLKIANIYHLLTRAIMHYLMKIVRMCYLLKTATISLPSEESR